MYVGDRAFVFSQQHLIDGCPLAGGNELKSAACSPSPHRSRLVILDSLSESAHRISDPSPIRHDSSFERVESAALSPDPRFSHPAQRILEVAQIVVRSTEGRS